jgi:hypothetical protein
MEVTRVAWALSVTGVIRQQSRSIVLQVPLQRDLAHNPTPLPGVLRGGAKGHALALVEWYEDGSGAIIIHSNALA